MTIEKQLAQLARIRLMLNLDDEADAATAVERLIDAARKVDEANQAARATIEGYVAIEQARELKAPPEA